MGCAASLMPVLSCLMALLLLPASSTENAVSDLAWTNALKTSEGPLPGVMPARPDRMGCKYTKKRMRQPFFRCVVWEMVRTRNHNWQV